MNLSGALNFNTLDSLGRLFGLNYKTDYSPIVEVAVHYTKQIFQEKYASKVFKNGGFQALDNLSDFEKKFKPFTY